MTEQTTTHDLVEENVNAAIDQAAEAADAFVSLGRQVTSLWLDVTRSAIEAAAATLSTTSDTMRTLADSMGEFSDRVEGAAKKA